MDRTFPFLLREEPVPPDRAEDVECYILYELERRGLADWTFFWDRARRRLGACWYARRSISLSRHLLGEGGCSGIELRDTILHEIAHALSFTHGGERGHGVLWKRWCLFLGARPRRCASPGVTGQHRYRYMLRRRDTGEVIVRYLRKPRFKHSLKYMMIRNDPSSKGQLEVVPYEENLPVGGEGIFS